MTFAGPQTTLEIQVRIIRLAGPGVTVPGPPCCDSPARTGRGATAADDRGAAADGRGGRLGQMALFDRKVLESICGFESQERIQVRVFGWAQAGLHCPSQRLVPRLPAVGVRQRRLSRSLARCC